jgi:hypothetical protein
LGRLRLPRARWEYLTIDRKQAFEAFIRQWQANEIGAFGDHGVDPNDREDMINRQAAELTALARQKAFRAALQAAAQPFGGVDGYVRDMYRRAEAAAKRGLGDITVVE